MLPHFWRPWFGIIAFWLSLSSASGQVIHRWCWTFTPGRPAHATATVTDQAGNVYVTGTIQDTLVRYTTRHLEIANTDDLFIAKFSPSGRQLWLALGGSRDSTGESHALTVDATGQAYITGTFKGRALRIGTTTLTNRRAGSSDFFVAKVSAAGHWQWAVRGGGPRYDLSHAIAFDPTSQDIYVAGLFQERASFGPDTLTTIEGYQGFVARLTSSGQWRWTIAVDSGYTECRSLAPAPGGGMYVAGDFGVAPQSSMDSDLAVAKLRPTGTWEWIARAEYATIGDQAGLAVDVAGNAYVTGQLTAYPADSQTNDTVAIFGLHRVRRLSATDAVIAKVSPRGEWQWAVGVALTPPHSRSSAGTTQALAVDAHGNVYVAGRFHQAITFGPVTLRAHGDADYPDGFLARLSSSGRWMGATSFGSTGYDEATGLARGRRNRLIMVGNFDGTIQLGRHWLHGWQRRAAEGSLFVGSATVP